MSARVDPSVRLFACAAAFAAGTLIAEAARPSPVVACACALAGAACALALRRARAAVLIVALGLGVGLAGLRLASVERSALARAAAHGADALLDGRILDDPEVDRGALRFTLAVSRAELDARPAALHERALVSIRPAPARAPAHGDLVRIDARLRPLLFRGIDGAAARAALDLARHGVSARALANPQGLTVRGPGGGTLDAIADRGRAAVRSASRFVPRADRGLLLGVTIGDTSSLDRDVQLDFRATGLSHVVAVSGANVAFVLAFVGFLLRLAGAGRRASVVALGLTLVAFMAVARFEPSVLRAGLMTGIGLAGVLLGARSRALTSLAVAVLVLLAHDPFLIHDPGFQLSTLATLGILVLTPRLAERLPQGRLAQAAAVSIGAQLAVAPIIAIEFHQLSLVSIAANLLVVPAVAPATIAGMAGATGALAWRPLGAVAAVATPALMWMRSASHVLAQLPLASVVTPAGGLGASFALAMAVLAVRAARPRRPSARAAVARRPKVLPAALALMLVATGGVWARALHPPPPRGLVVTMIDVGQGDAFVVRAGGRTMMIDGGPETDATLTGLRALGVHRIDLLVLTHPHADHITGLAAVAERFPVGRALDPYIDVPLPEYGAFVRALAARAEPRDRAIAGMVYRLGPARIDVLWPPGEHMEGTPSDVNNNSIVLRVRYGAQTVLFAGEVQEEAQQLLLRDPAALRADVLKVSHHGSAHMLPEFYAATHARVALIPVGPNTFGHPAAQTLIALRGMRVYRSDRNGTVTVGLDGARGIDVRAARAAAA